MKFASFPGFPWHFFPLAAVCKSNVASDQNLDPVRRPGNEADSCGTQCTYDIVRQYWQNGTTCIDSQPPHVGTLSNTPSVWRHPQQWSPWEQSLDSLSATATAVGYEDQGSHGHHLECARKVHNEDTLAHCVLAPRVYTLDMSTVYREQDLIDDIVNSMPKHSSEPSPAVLQLTKTLEPKQYLQIHVLCSAT